MPITLPKRIHFMTCSHVKDLFGERQGVMDPFLWQHSICKNPQIRNLSFFFYTTTIGDNQVTSLIDATNPITINLSKSCLTIAT
jgi:hypothetical protein